MSEEEQKRDDVEEITQSFKIDLIADYGNTQEDLVMHWGISKKNPGEWTSPDDRYLTSSTARFSDGKACQTTFIRDVSTPSIRAIKLNIWWKEGVEPAVKTLSFVLFEKKKNAWYNNSNRDYHIKFELSPPPMGTHHHGKIGDVVKEIIECETVFVSLHSFVTVLGLMDVDASL